MKIYKNIFKKLLFKNPGIIAIGYFDYDFSHIEPNEFLNLLKNNFFIQHFVCSTDFSFGHNKSGNIDTIKEFGHYTYVVDPAIINNQKVSTSLIKNYILNGDIETTNRLIGRPFFIKGSVIKGKQKGREYGFPTLNFYN